MIRVVLPYHLQTLAHVGREIQLQLDSPVTIRLILETLEIQYPMLRGTIRDYARGERRAFIRFFACGQDLSLDAWDTPLPDTVVKGIEPFRIVGAMAGG
jgi:molybdopterin synthase sulfur carrier subunit